MRNLALVRVAIAVMAVAGATASGAQEEQEEREADHEQLRQLLVQVRDAVNRQDVDALRGLMRDPPVIILSDASLFTDLDDLAAYYARLLDPADGPVESLRVDPEADALTEFLGPDVGLSHGTSTDTFTLRGGLARQMQSRWTAALVREEGVWKIASIQIGANVLDNAILHEYQRIGRGVAIAAGAVGLLLGAVAGALWVRRRVRA